MKKLINKNVFLFGLIFYVLAVLPYVIISKGSAYLESRYYYLPLVGAVVLFASIKLTSFKSRLIACGLLVIFLVSQFVQIQKILDEKIKISSVRKEIVEQIYEIPLNGIKHNLVYIESDTDYVVEGQKLPFQQGVGYMIMVLFYEHSVIPDEFLTRDYLWDIGTEGYVTNNENSFGYFVNKKTFEKAIEETSEMDHNQIFLKYYNNNLQINIQN